MFDSQSAPPKQEVIETRHEDLHDEKAIATGTFGDIYYARHDRFGHVVCKRLRATIIRDTDKMAGQLKRDALGLGYRHKNIVAVLGIVFQTGYYGVLLECAPYGSLDRFTEKYQGDIEWPVTLSFAADVASGMDFLHGLTPPIVHGDLKQKNVLIAEKCVAKVSDFGLSKWKQYSIRSTGAKSSPSTITHIPPENWRNINMRWTQSFDVYGFGILLWEILSQRRAFETARDLRLAVISGERPDVKQIQAGPADTGEILKKLITESWDEDPDKRPTSEVIADTLAKLEENHKENVEQSMKKLAKAVKHRSWSC